MQKKTELNPVKRSFKISVKTEENYFYYYSEDSSEDHYELLLLF